MPGSGCDSSNRRVSPGYSQVGWRYDNRVIMNGKMYVGLRVGRVIEQRCVATPSYERRASAPGRN